MKIGNHYYCNTCGCDMTNTVQRKEQKYCGTPCARVPYDARKAGKTSKAYQVYVQGQEIAKIRLEKYQKELV